MLRALLSFFSRYAHPFEKKVDRFFRSVRSSSDSHKTHRRLEKLMQENLVITNLWMEKKYKNYVYLKKRIRREMYANVEILKAEFLRYAEERSVNRKSLIQRIEKLGLSIPAHLEDRLVYLSSIMAYLKPGPHYRYQKQANFGKLLKNPLKEALVGDCNQIVTLYIYLYSLRYPVSELKIKILPQHVCLHFEGIDIEATNATFKHYKKFEYILPITEIISTNLLDVVDEEVRTAEIDPRVIVKRAQLAYLISSMRDLVTRNLEVAYRNVGIRLMKANDYKSALFFFEKLKDRQLLQKGHYNATLYYMKRNNFSKAAYHAKHTGKPELPRKVTYREGAYYYKQGKYRQALSAFRKIDDQRMVRACYQQQYIALRKTVKGVKTYQDAKRYKSTYRKMLSLAQKAQNEAAVNYVQGILSKI